MKYAKVRDCNLMLNDDIQMKNAKLFFYLQNAPSRWITRKSLTYRQESVIAVLLNLDIEMKNVKSTDK